MSNERVAHLYVVLPSHHYGVDECCDTVDAYLFEMGPCGDTKVIGGLTKILTHVGWWLIYLKHVSTY